MCHAEFLFKFIWKMNILISSVRTRRPNAQSNRFFASIFGLNDTLGHARMTRKYQASPDRQCTYCEE